MRGSLPLASCRFHWWAPSGWRLGRGVTVWCQVCKHTLEPYQLDPETRADILAAVEKLQGSGATERIKKFMNTLALGPLDRL